GLWATFTSADPDTIDEREDGNHPVTDHTVRSTATGVQDRPDRRLDEVLVYRDLELDSARHVNGDLVAAIDLSGSLLPAETLDIHDCEAEDLDLRERLLHGFELGRLDDSDNQLHEQSRKCHT